MTRPRPAPQPAARDRVSVPVRFRGAIDHAGTRRPHPSAVTKTHPPWARGWAPDGWRDVGTTWREIMFAAVMVGRDPTPWLVTQPRFAGFERLARVSPLAAYLRRARPTTGGYRLGPSPVYTSGAERSAQGAFAYRLGMTMAEWSARRLVDAAPTTHVESVAPPGAGLGWALPGRRSDLWAVGASRDLWMIEAKAARKLGRPQMREGAAQLAALAPPVLAAPHGRLLAGTSVDRELFVLLERDPPAPAPSPTGAARARARQAEPGAGVSAVDALLVTVRARMAIYFALAAAPAPALRLVPVVRASEAGREAPERLPTLAEDDLQTQELRSRIARIRSQLPRPARAADLPARMLVADVPQAGVTVGLSRAAYSACRTLAGTLRELMQDDDLRSDFADELDLVAVADGDTADDDRIAEDRRLAGLARAQRVAPELRGPVADAYRTGDASDWGALLDRLPETEPAASLTTEVYDDDSYLALLPQSLLWNDLAD